MWMMEVLNETQTQYRLRSRPSIGRLLLLMVQTRPSGTRWLPSTYRLSLLLLGDSRVSLDDSQVVQLPDQRQGAGLGRQLLVGAVFSSSDPCGMQSNILVCK